MRRIDQVAAWRARLPTAADMRFRAHGRRHINAHRQHLARLRQLRLIELLGDEPPLKLGLRRRQELANILNVHHATIYRDIRRIERCEP